MDIFLQIVVGLGLTAIGVIALKFNYQLVGMTGNVGFAERYLGAGGTYSLYKIVGVILTIFGLVYATGLGAPVLTWLLSPVAKFFPGAN
jgi:hypothetical protein